jgi:hypothetical protein
MHEQPAVLGFQAKVKDDNHVASVTGVRCFVSNVSVRNGNVND